MPFLCAVQRLKRLRVLEFLSETACLTLSLKDFFFLYFKLHLHCTEWTTSSVLVLMQLIAEYTHYLEVKPFQRRL